MIMNKTAAIVVTYNRKNCLIQNIKHLLEQDRADFDILIIDNASTDGTKEAVKDFLSNGNVLYFNTGDNLGGAGGFNFGMRKAVEAGYDYIWIMDDDCYVHTDTLSRLFEADKKLEGKYGFLSSIAYFTDGSLCNMNIQKTTIKDKIEDYDSPLVRIVMATFVSAFFKADVIKKFGLPIKEFFIWSDDLEYTRRISRELPCYAVTNSKVTHAMNSNNKVNIATESADRLSRYGYLYRNEVFVYSREGLGGKFYLFARVCFHIIKVILKSNGSRFAKIKTILKSYFSGFKFHPPIEYI
ncbi:MAG: glycosyltransferase family 2 protein [Acutalibacteraceae bacterium]